MQRERVSEGVYWFQSDVYAQVTAGVIAGPQWAVVIDTLPVPEETLKMRQFIEEQLKVPVQYVVNTHYHADHTWGNCFFPGATVISHEICRKLQLEHGQASLDAAQKQDPIFRQVKLIAPHMTFASGNISLKVGKKSLVIFHTPGHSPDGISILIEEDRVLFAADAFLPIPYFVNGDIEQLKQTLKSFNDLGLENIVQGHGDIVLRGEIENLIDENIHYLNTVQKKVKAALKDKFPKHAIKNISIESCGKERVTLGGLGNSLHENNVQWLLQKYAAESGIDLLDIPLDYLDDEVVDY